MRMIKRTGMSLLVFTILLIIPVIRSVDLFSQGFEWLRGGTYDTSVPTPESVLGYKIGEYLTDHLQMTEYMRTLAEASNRVQVFRYGQSVERRELILVVIGTPQNMDRLEEIRVTIEKLTDPRITDEMEAKRIAGETPAIGWINFSTDGNETAAFECGMQLAYQLAAGTDPLTAKILENVVVVINPCLSPDSHQWFTTWSKAVTVGNQGTADPAATEHHNLWFNRSDGNHYFIDMNRDAFALTQVETRAAARVLHHWNPQIWVDNHGQPTEYFFAPFCSPINRNYPPSLLKWATVIGKNNARYFDQYGWTFVKDERYDIYYPGYWDSYPSFNGAIGMTYETNGGGSKGFRWERPDKSIVTLLDAIHHHFTADMATLEVLADNREEMLLDFYRFRKTGMDEAGEEQFKQYILLPGMDEGRLNSLVELLLRHRIEIYRMDKPFSSKRAQTYFDRVMKKRNFPAGSYVIPMRQPQKRLLKTLFEPDPELEDKFLKEVEATRIRNKKLGSDVPKEPLFFYDITAWALPVTYGIEAAFIEDGVKLPPEGPITEIPKKEGKVVSGRAGYAYLFSYYCDAGAKLCGRLLQEGYKVAVSLKDFRNSGMVFPKGTLIARVKRNPESLHDRIAELARTYGIDVTGVNTAWSEEGISLGSIFVVPLKKPRIMVVTDNPTSPTAFGGVYSLLEQRFGLEFTAVRGEHFSNIDLFRYNVIVFPDGSAKGYAKVLGKTGVKKLKTWIENGGTFIGIKGGAVFTTSKDVALTDVKFIGEKISIKNTEGKKDTTRIPFENIPGSIFRASVNTDYYLGLGYPEEIAVQVRGRSYLSKTKKGVNVATFPEQSYIMGHKWDDTEAILSSKVYLADVPLGKGRVILFANDPTFRAFWWGLDRLFLSSVLFSTAF